MEIQGERVGPYVKVSLLGKGGFGEVWKAWDERLSRWVALKLVRVEDAEELRRFQREARTAASLAHPNIASIYEVGEAAGRHFIAMQLVDGHTLQRVPHRKPRDLARFVRDAARAVAHAHVCGVIHRDLKPANIMVESSMRVFVMDFGLARPLKAGGSLTMSGAVVGTPAYMSPEQARGDTRAVDGRSDVYSLGATLYELLAGRPAFQADDVLTLLAMVANEEPSSIRRPLPRELVTIAMKCLEKDPERRYPTAAALADDLTRWLEGEPILAHPPSTFYRLRKRLAKHRALAAAVLAGLAGIVVVVSVLVPQLIRRDRALAAREALRPLEDTIRDARPYLYIAGSNIADRLRRVETALAEAEKIEPKDAEIWLTIGMGWHFVGDRPKAEEALLKAASLKPDDARVNFHLARVLVEQGFMASTFRTAERDEGPSPPVLDAAQKEAVRAAAARYLDRVPSSAAGLREIDQAVLAACRAIALGDDRQAGRICEESLKRLDGEMGAEDLWLLLGMVAVPASKITAYANAIRKRPHYDLALLWRGITHEQQGALQQALDDLDQAILVNPRLTQAYTCRGTVRLYTKDEEGALADFNEAIRRQPEHPAAYLNRSTLRLRRHEWDLAAADAAECIRRAPRLPAGYRNLCRAHTGKRDLAAALAVATQAVDVDPSQGESLLLRALVLQALGDRTAAEADVDQAVRVKPTARAYVHRGNMRSARGDARGALSDYDQAVKLDPQRSESWYNRGLQRQAMQDFDGAIADFTSAIRLDQRFVLAYGNRANALTSKGDLDGAIRDFDKALELDPRYADGYFNRGIARMNLQQVDAAISDFTEALKHKPDWPDAYGARGQSRRIKGDRSGAISDYERALQVAQPDWPHRGHVEQLLAQARKS